MSDSREQRVPPSIKFAAGVPLLVHLVEASRQYKESVPLFSESADDFTQFADLYLRQYFPQLNSVYPASMESTIDHHFQKMQFFLFLTFVLIVRHFHFKSDSIEYAKQFTLASKVSLLKLRKAAVGEIQQKLTETEEMMSGQQITSKADLDESALWHSLEITLKYLRMHQLPLDGMDISEKRKRELQDKLDTIPLRLQQSAEKLLIRTYTPELQIITDPRSTAIFPSLTINPLEKLTQNRVQMFIPLLTISQDNTQPHQIDIYMYRELIPDQLNILGATILAFNSQLRRQNGWLLAPAEWDQKPRIYLNGNLQVPCSHTMSMFYLNDFLFKKKSPDGTPLEVDERELRQLWQNMAKFFEVPYQLEYFLTKQSALRKQHKLLGIQSEE